MNTGASSPGWSDAVDADPLGDMAEWMETYRRTAGHGHLPTGIVVAPAVAERLDWLARVTFGPFTHRWPDLSATVAPRTTAAQVWLRRARLRLSWWWTDDHGWTRADRFLAHAFGRPLPR